jgi:hypothetical protein
LHRVGHCRKPLMGIAMSAARLFCRNPVLDCA